ncbi:ATP-binding protein [Nocardiopsis sp. HNM0947]|uniref:histidine kinase n=1 Tax=Nocardiopsis coralli TaxID=2772213 RepID=A0ABR9PDR5_9ACTN|nr:histidine kinase [Nocardiopsis coralli]MBE3001987.1 ATP-binding protein [Nocardiopsis coralli]
MFGTARNWSRRHETLVDTVTVAPLLLLHASGALAGGLSASALSPAHLAVGFALLLPLVVRRRFPVAVFAAVAAAAAVQMGLGVGLILADVAVLVALYTVAAHARTVWATGALGVVEAGLLLALVRSPYTDRGDWDVLALYTFLILLCWVTGLYMKLRRRYVLGLEERNRWLERERDARARAAAAEERERIAREMHDVVAHNISVMVVQAEGATYAVEHDPGRAQGAMRTVAETGRSALSEVRGILGALRGSDDDPEGGEGPGHEGHDAYAPSPGIDSLDRVAEQVRAAGVPVDLTFTGEQRPLPAGVELAAFRVVQEALTNALKHAGPGTSRVRVEVEYGARALTLRVRDDGRGLLAPGHDGRGQGLVGMRERVSVHGGWLRAGPCSDGGFEVVATLPV